MKTSVYEAGMHIPMQRDGMVLSTSGSTYCYQSDNSTCAGYRCERNETVWRVWYTENEKVIELRIGGWSLCLALAQETRPATKDNKQHDVAQMSLLLKLKDERTPEMSNMSGWTFDQFLNSQLSCHVLIFYAKPISQNTAESRRDRLKINEPVNAGALRYCLTARFVKYSISGKQTSDPWTFSFTSPWCVYVCVVFVCAFTQTPDVLA